MQKLNLSDLQYVLFDWDNTLADTKPVLIAAINRVLHEFNLPSWEHVAPRRDKNISFQDNFCNFFGPDLASEAYHRYCQLYPSYAHNYLTSFPGVKEVLAFFNSHHIPMLILSNKDRRLLDMEIPLLFDTQLFLRTVAGHEAPHDKPSPDHIFYALSGLVEASAISPSAVWMIGDTMQDSNCALAARALPIRIGSSIWNDNDYLYSDTIYFHDFIKFLTHLQS